jgi:hypothetical protein
MKRILLALFAVAAMLLAGCIDYEETITLNDDGSGTIKFHYGIDKMMMQQMDSLSSSFGDAGASPGGMDEDIWTKEEIKTALKKKHPGIKLIDYREFEDEDWKIWELEFTFESLAEFEAFSTVMDSVKEEAKESEADRTYVRQDDGSWLFTHRFHSADDSDMMAPPADFSDFDMQGTTGESKDQPVDESSGEDTEAAIQSDDTTGSEQGLEKFGDAMTGLSEGMGSMMSSIGKAKVRISVTFPGEIVETNATSTEGKTAIWEYSGMGLMNASSVDMTAKIRQ